MEKPDEFSGAGSISFVPSMWTMEGSGGDTGGEEADACWMSRMC